MPRFDRKKSARSTLFDAIYPSRAILAVFGFFAFLPVQYVLRKPLAGYTTTWFETGLPFRILDSLLALVLVPVHSALDVVYDPWAPDWAFVLLAGMYFYALAIVIGACYDRIVR